MTVRKAERHTNVDGRKQHFTGKVLDIIQEISLTFPQCQSALYFINSASSFVTYVYCLNLGTPFLVLSLKIVFLHSMSSY